jgi:hypothetical protein
MLVERNTAEPYQPGESGAAGLSKETAEILDGVAHDLHALQRELNLLAGGLQAARPEDHTLTLANAVRLEGLSQARSLIRRAHLVLERASKDAQLAEQRAPRDGGRPAVTTPSQAVSVAPPRANGSIPARANRTDGTTLALTVLPPDGEFQRYRVEGPLTFAAMLALKQSIARLPGVRSVRVAPRPEGTTLLTLISENPERTVQDLQDVPGFSMSLVAA